jgi:hypothetical protein
MNVYCTHEEDYEEPTRRHEWIDMGARSGRRSKKRKAGRSTAMGNASTSSRQHVIDRTNAIHRGEERRFAREVEKAYRGDGETFEVEEPPRVVGGFYAM